MDGTSGRQFVSCRKSPSCPFSKHQINNIHESKVSLNQNAEEELTTRLLLSSHLPVFLKWNTIKGLPIKVTITTNWGMARLIVKVAFFNAGQKTIQWQLSAPLSLFTINSVMVYRSRLPKTLAAVRCRQRLNSLKSKNGSSIIFCRYRLPT